MRKMINSAALMLLTTVGLIAMVGTVGAQKKHRLPDSTIKTIVEYRLVDKGLQHNDNIKVSVDDHIVTLQGTVRSQAEKRRAEQIAHGVEDVDRVENKLVVEESKRSDQQIADDIAHAIRSFVFYDIFDWIEGNVKNGVVTLKGAVREPWRKKDYERLVENVPGVKEIKNEIRVLPTSIYDDQLRIATARLIYGDPRFVRYANRSLPPIHIIVDNGRITLEGAVANQLEKQLAETIVRSGVLSFDVTNNLKVDTQLAKS